MHFHVEERGEPRKNARCEQKCGVDNFQMLQFTHAAHRRLEYVEEHSSSTGDGELFGLGSLGNQGSGHFPKVQNLMPHDLAQAYVVSTQRGSI